MMEFKIQLSDEEQSWLEQIASHSDVSRVTAIKNLIRERYETMTMELAFAQYPDGKVAASDGKAASDRGSRKAALKLRLIERASQRNLKDSETEM
jgi:predicted transcriptional regulator